MAKEYDGYTVQENCIEWIKGSDRATVTFPRGRFATNVAKLAKQYPDEVQICDKNKDGSIVAHMPVNYITIRHPRIYSEEQKVKMGERLRQSKNLSNMDEN